MYYDVLIETYTKQWYQIEADSKEDLLKFIKRHWDALDKQILEIHESQKVFHERYSKIDQNRGYGFGSINLDDIEHPIYCKDDM